MKPEITLEDKIDYIYDTLQKQEKRYKWGMLLKWGFRICILIYIYIFVVHMLPGIMQNVTQSLTPDITNISSENIDTEKLLEQVKQILQP